MRGLSHILLVFELPSILFLFLFSVLWIYLLYIVFPRCSSHKYFVQSMLKSYIEKLYFLHVCRTYALKLCENFFG